MTHEEVAKLTDEEIRIKVAELCGWKSIEPYKPEGCQLYKDLFGLKRGRFGQIPNYPQDLNACHEMEKCLRLTGVEGTGYVGYLEQIVLGAPWPEYDANKILHMTRATARQRCNAFVMTLTAVETP